MTEASSNEVSRRFAGLGAEFLALVSQPSIDARELLIRAQLLLSRLYTCALELGEVGHPGDEEPIESESPASGAHDVAKARFKMLSDRLGSLDGYREVFDAYGLSDEEPVGGSLADDLADIADDLAEGLAAWQRGARDLACWSWRFSFESHWGEHATSAIRAIHVLRFMHQFEKVGDQGD